MPCKKIFTNEQTLFHHKRGRKHIKMVNKMSSGAASIPASEIESVKDQFVDEEKEMELWLLILVIAGWVILNKWILPKCGVAT